MTQHDIEILAQFASNWRMLKHNESLKACLKLDLCEHLEKHCLNFDRQSYWAMIEKTSD